MAPSRPLAVAAAAAILLVLVVGVDASMDRSLHVDRREADGAWVPLASAGEVPMEKRYPYYPAGAVQVADRNESIPLRVRVENGYPWAFGKAYVAYAQGVEVARGRLAAEPGATGTAEFTVPVQRLAGATPRPFPEAEGVPEVHYGVVEVRVGGLVLHAEVQVEVTS